MNPTAVSTDLKQLRATVVMQRYSIFGLVGAIVLSLMVVYNLTGRQQTVLVPPVIEKTFWVSHDKVSGSYLEQMAAFVSYLLLDVAPASIEWKKNLLQQYVLEPKQGEYETRQKLESDRLKGLNASTQFAITGLIANERDMTVLVNGRLSTYINGSRTSEEEKSFLASFVYTNSRIHLNKFEEVTAK